jgi:hypothetical protein
MNTVLTIACVAGLAMLLIGIAAMVVGLVEDAATIIRRWRRQ